MLSVYAECRQLARGFPDIPLHGMQAIAPVRNVRRSDVLGGGQQVLHAYGKQGAERNFKGQGADVDVIISAGGWMQVDAVTADPYGVRERGRGNFSLRQARLRHARFQTHMLFEHGEFGPDAPGLPDVRPFCESVPRACQVAAQPQPGPALAPIGSGGFRLQPVEERPTQAQRPVEVPGFFRIVDIHEIAQ